MKEYLMYVGLAFVILFVVLQVVVVLNESAANESEACLRDEKSCSAYYHCAYYKEECEKFPSLKEQHACAADTVQKSTKRRTGTGGYGMHYSITKGRIGFGPNIGGIGF